MNTHDFSTPYDSVRTISAEALLQEMRSGVPLTVLDVRARPEIRATGAIPEARTFPIAQLPVRVAELAPLRSTIIVVVSQRGRRARTAVAELEARGFTEVVLLDGGMHRWLELGYPVEARRDSTPSFVP